MDELDYWDADVACLQEVDDGPMWADVKAAMAAKGYAGTLKRRSVSRRNLG